MAKTEANKQETKLCTACTLVLPLDKFESFVDGSCRSACRECVAAQRARKASANYKSYLNVLLTQLKSSRRKEDIEFNLVKDELFAIWDTQQGRCALSGVILTHHRDGKYGDGKKKEFNASIDRINPKGPYTRDNVQLVAARVNTMKHTLGEDMFMWWIKNLYDHALDRE